MNIIEIYTLMDSGLGVKPEVLIFMEVNNFITVRLSKRFKGERHYQQFEIAHPAINKNYASELKAKTEYYVEALQRYINVLDKD